MTKELKQPISNISKEVQTYKNNKLNKSDTDVVIDNIDDNNRKMNYLITDVLGINANAVFCKFFMNEFSNSSFVHIHTLTYHNNLNILS